MVQCNLKKKDLTMTAWVPAKFAHVGKYLKILGDNGWLVTEAYHGTKLDPTYVREHQRVRFASL